MGQIPLQLTNPTYLEIFNVSQNHLKGRIPHGSQFNTFSDDSYYGNSELWDFPLPDCGANNGPPSPPANLIFHEADCLDLLEGFIWKSVALGYGFGLILGLAVGGLIFLIGKPMWFLKIADDARRLLGIKTKKRLIAFQNS